MSFTLREGQSRTELGVEVAYLGQTHKHRADRGAAEGLWRLAVGSDGETREIELHGDEPRAELPAGERLVIVGPGADGLAITVHPALPPRLSDEEARAILLQHLKDHAVLVPPSGGAQSSANGIVALSVGEGGETFGRAAIGQYSRQLGPVRRPALPEHGPSLRHVVETLRVREGQRKTTKEGATVRVSLEATKIGAPVARWHFAATRDGKTSTAECQGHALYAELRGPDVAYTAASSEDDEHYVVRVVSTKGGRLSEDAAIRKAEAYLHTIGIDPSSSGSSIEGGVLSYVAPLGSGQIAVVSVGLHSRQILSFGLEAEQTPR